MEDDLTKTLYPADYPEGSLQRELYNWGKEQPGMNMGNTFESGHEFIARLLQQHPERVAPFVAKWKMGVLDGK